MGIKKNSIFGQFKQVSFFSFSLTLCSLYMMTGSQDPSVEKYKNILYFTKQLFQAQKPLNSKLNRCAASYSLNRCNFTKDSWVSDPRELECPQEVLHIKGHHHSPLSDAGKQRCSFLRSSFGFLFRVLIANEFISPAYLKI